MARIFALLTVLAALVGFTPWLVPLAKQGVRLVEARDDPAAIADLGLRSLDAATVSKDIEAALADDDAALATSFLELADARGLTIPQPLRDKVAAANGSVASALRSAKEFGMGFVTGEPQELAGLVGAAAGDLMVWGDIRDASREGWKLAQGKEADELILGLSAVGIAVTAGTYATVGGGLPARVGITLVKVAKRTGRLSAALGRTFMRALRESVDFAALRRLGTAPLEADKAALKGAVRTDRLAGLTRMLDDVAVVQSKAGTRAALESMRLAENGGDLTRMAALAEAKGGQTLAILKTLGRGAIRITGALLTLVWWVFVAATYVYLLVSSFNAFCVACARPLWRRKRNPAARAERRRRWWQRRRAEAPARVVPAPADFSPPVVTPPVLPLPERPVDADDEAIARAEQAARRVIDLMDLRGDPAQAERPLEPPVIARPKRPQEPDDAALARVEEAARRVIDLMDLREEPPLAEDMTPPAQAPAPSGRPADPPVRLGRGVVTRTLRRPGRRIRLGKAWERP